MIKKKFFAEHLAYIDYDIIDTDNIIYRICPPTNLKKGDSFNVYSVNENGESGRKTSFTYQGGKLEDELEIYKNQFLKLN